MARLSRYTQKLFGSSAAVGEIKKFGSKAAGAAANATTPAEAMELAEYLGGWHDAVIGGNSPCIEDMNALFYMIAYQLGYLMQSGIAEWDTSTDYHIGQLVQDGAGIVYISLTNSNSGNALTSTTNWQPLVSQQSNVTAPASSGNIALTTGVVLADATSGANTQTLPSAASAKWRKFTVKKTDSSANPVIIAGTIDGTTNLYLTMPNEAATVVSDGSNYYRI